MVFAAASSKFAFVYLVDGELFDWGISVKASAGVDEAFSQAVAWIGFYHPDVVVTESITYATRKGDHSKSLIKSIEGAASHKDVHHVSIARRSTYPNKYKQAAALAEEFPQIAPWLPPEREIWEKEPRNIILFEALGLAVTYLRQNGTGGPAN